MLIHENNSFILKILHEAFLPLLFGMLGAIVVSLVVYVIQKPPVTIATVNVTHIVNRFIKEMRDKNIPAPQLQSQTQQFGKKLEYILKRLSKDEDVILLPSEAVIAGSEDYTNYVNQILNE